MKKINNTNLQTFRSSNGRSFTCTVTYFVSNAKFKTGITTTGIGDGGNEVGMGFALEIAEKVIGEAIACHVSIDCLIPARYLIGW